MRGAWTLAVCLPLLAGACKRHFNAAAEPRVFGGRQAESNELRATVDVWGPSDSSIHPHFIQMCSGVLLAPRVVLTAAHCLGIGMGADSVNTFGGPWADHRVRIHGPGVDAESLASLARAPGSRIPDVLRTRAASLAELVGDDGYRSQFEPLLRRLANHEPLSEDDLAHLASAAISEQGVPVLKARVMPDYDGDNYRKPDLALLLLAAHDKPTTTAKIASPAVSENERLVFAGYGLTSEVEWKDVAAPRVLSVATNFAQVAAVPALDPNADARWFFASTWDPQAARQHANLNPPYGLTCRGDSGGPVYRTSGSEPLVVGIVSRVAERPSQDNCQPGTAYAKIYSRLDSQAVQQWIASTLAEWQP